MLFLFGNDDDDDDDEVSSWIELSFFADDENNEQFSLSYHLNFFFHLLTIKGLSFIE